MPKRTYLLQIAIGCAAQAGALRRRLPHLRGGAEGGNGGEVAGCSLEVYDLTKRYEELAAKLKQYRIRCVPTLVIDGRIKLEGKPEFALICDEEMYRFLEERYSTD